jgi:hypothetical protein
MHELITLADAAKSTGTNPSTLRDWISKDVIAGAVEIKSRGMAGGRKGYYPVTIIGEIKSALKMQEDGLTLATIAKARALALELMADPSKDADANATAEVGPAARQWLNIYSEITGDPRAQDALERLVRDISHLLTLVINGLRYNMIDIVERTPEKE